MMMMMMTVISVMVLVLVLVLVLLLVLLVLLLLLLHLLVEELHLDLPTARRHRLDHRPLPVAEARAVVSTCMPGGSSERHSAYLSPRRAHRARSRREASQRSASPRRI